MTALNTLVEEILNCHACKLAGGRTNVVPGEGSMQSEIMFIGEAPGLHEDRQGKPFVGAAGQFLDELLQLIGLNRGTVYIANVIKCRPPNNRDPRPEEINACKPWLERQINIIGPKIIVTLGRFSLSLFLPGNAIGSCHGKPFNANGIIYFPMYHPAAALHQYRLREVIKSDMLKVPGLLQTKKDLTSNQQVDSILPAQQLKLL